MSHPLPIPDLPARQWDPPRHRAASAEPSSSVAPSGGPDRLPAADDPLAGMYLGGLVGVTLPWVAWYRDRGWRAGGSGWTQAAARDCLRGGPGQVLPYGEKPED